MHGIAIQLIEVISVAIAILPVFFSYPMKKINPFNLVSGFLEQGKARNFFETE